MRSTRCLGLGVILLVAVGSVRADDEPPSSPRKRAVGQTSRGVTVSRVVKRPDQQTKLAVLQIVRSAGHANHRVRADAVRQYYRQEFDERAYLPLITGLTYSAPLSRAFAARALGGLGLPNAIDALARRALFDSNETVRRASVESVKQLAQRFPKQAIRPFVGSLRSRELRTKSRAAQALGHVGDPGAIIHLVQEIEVVGGRGPRVNAFFGSQVAYIRGYNAEVAQAAAIAEPEVGTIQAGAVIDARVIRTRRRTRIYHRVVRRALERITGAKVGDEPGAWRKWYADRTRAAKTRNGATAGGTSEASPRRRSSVAPAKKD